MKKSVLTSALLALLFATSLAVNLFQFRSSKTSESVSTIGAPAVQSQILCDVAKEQLREHWNDQRASIVRIIRVVNNPSEMEGKLKLNLQEISKAVPLNVAQIEEFAPRYEKIFRAHVEKFKSFLNAKPQSDWTGMLATMKEFYASEDALITSSFGQQATESYRLSQARKRTPILAIIAQYANLDWGQSIEW
ncbi:MAG: hypothetical protein ABL958_04855 [Bdellovibrionia bacterium]